MHCLIFVKIRSENKIVCFSFFWLHVFAKRKREVLNLGRTTFSNYGSKNIVSGSMERTDLPNNVKKKFYRLYLKFESS